MSLQDLPLCTQIKLAVYFGCCKCICFKKPKPPPPPKVQRNVLCLGITGAGKTTILTRMAVTQEEDALAMAMPHPEPTNGFKVSSVWRHNYEFNFWEVGGSEGMRKYWFRYTKDVDAVCFVVDSSTAAAVAEAAPVIKDFVDKHCQWQWPVLVLANKQDVPGAQTPDQVRESLVFENEPARWKVMACTAADATKVEAQGLMAALDWLMRVL
jgi:small GTP-binding protein